MKTKINVALIKDGEGDGNEDKDHCGFERRGDSYRESEKRFQRQTEKGREIVGGGEGDGNEEGYGKRGREVDGEDKRGEKGEDDDKKGEEESGKDI